MLQKLVIIKFGYFLAFSNLWVLALLENPPPLLSNVPIEFPKNESQYPFVHNTTILRVLASQTINDSEVDDLLHGGQTPTISRLEHVDIAETITEDNNLQSNLSDRKWDTELIQNSDKTEDYLFSNKTKFQPTRHTSYGSRLPLVHGEIAAILAIALVLVVVLGYVGLVSWRRYIEVRYGNRQMLVNEEDFYEPNDLRHFSIQ